MPSQEVTSVILPVHIVGGALALVFGYTALYATKGATLHRRAGMMFVYAMVTMSFSAVVLEALNTATVAVNVVAGLLTFYAVTTALFTVRRRPQPSWIDVASVLFALMVSVVAFTSGFALLSRGSLQTVPCFIFGVVALLGAVGDVRVLQAGGIFGRARIARHVWRMCFAMWVAAASFFWGPPQRVPEILRVPALQTVAVLLPIGVMVYWLLRLRARRPVRGVVQRPAHEAI